MELPEPGPAAVFVQRLHVHVAHAEGRLRPDPFGQEGLRRRIAVKDRVLGAFLVIDDELQCEPRLVRPTRMRRLGAVADHVARIGFAHRCSPGWLGGLTRR